MYFTREITYWLGDARDWFYSAYEATWGWPWPFHLIQWPLYYLYTAFHYLTWYFSEFDRWLEWAAGRIDAIISEIDIFDLFKWAFDAAWDAWTWVQSAPYYIWVEINRWWSSVWYDVVALFNQANDYAASLVAGVNTWLAQLQAALDDLAGRIPNLDEIVYWWGNWTGELLSVVNTWWSGTILEVQGLINSAFVEREPFWAGWQDWRDKVTEFFSDPEDWLYKAADRIIERFW